MRASGRAGLVVMAACLVLSGQAMGAPLITSVVPSEFDASKDEGIAIVLIRGYGIWEGASGYDEYAKRTKVYVRRDGALQVERTYSHGYWVGTDEQQLELQMPTDPWFNSPGVFEIVVKVDGVASNYFQVPILKGPPVILKVNQSRFTLSDKRDQEHEVRIVADNMGNPTEIGVRLDGKRIDHYYLGPGVLTAFIPESVFHDPGTYGLQVKSTVGISAPLDIQLTTGPLQAATGDQGAEGTALTTRLAGPLASVASKQVIEGEALAAGAKASAGSAGRQEMGAFGDAWSGGAQLFWGAPAAGATLTLALNVPAAGRFDVAAFFTRAPDFGTVQVLLDGQPLGGPIDCYGPGVTLGGRTGLGAAELKAGAHTLTLKVTGKDPLSRGYAVGLDRLELTPAAGTAPARQAVPMAPAGRLRLP